jgi:O-antigen/teichoic acid export membrane protein
MNISRSVVSVIGSQTITSLLNLVSFILFARILPTHEFGIFVLFLGVSHLCSAIIDMGFDGAVEKRVSEGKDAVLGTVLAFKIVLLTVLTVGIFVFKSQLDTYFGGPFALLLVPVLVVEQLGQVLLRTLRGELRVGFASSLRVVRYLTFLFSALALICQGLDVLALIAGHGLSWFAVAMIAYFRITTIVGLPSREMLRSLFSFAKYNFVPSVLSQRANNWVDVLVIGFFLSQTYVAAYEVAWRLSMAVMLASRSISTTIFPQISAWNENANQDSITELLPKALSGSIVLVFPAIAGTIVLQRQLLALIFRPEYAIATTALVLLVVGKIFQSINGVFARFLLGTGRVNLLARAAIVFLTCNVVLNVILVPLAGLAGAAIATSVAMAVNAGLLWRYSNRFFVVGFEQKLLSASLVASLGMSVVLLTITQFGVIDTLFRLVTVVSVGVFAFALFLLSNRDARRYARGLMDSL